MNEPTLRSEQQKSDPPKVQYDIVITWVLIALGCLSFWAFLTCLMVQRFSR